MSFAKLFLCLALLASSGAIAFAAERHAYDPKVFQSAIEAEKPILVHVTAPWCGECRAQKPIVATLAQAPEFKDLVILDVDFDTQKDVLRQLKVQKQSTLVVFKGKSEVARAVGITRPEAIETLMRRAL
jgi:thioredoxin 1